MEFNLYFLIILGTVVVLYHLELFSELLNMKALQSRLPAEFEGTFDQESYEKSQEYTRESTRFGMMESSVSLAVFLAFWFLGGFHWLDVEVRGMAEGEVMRGLIYLSALYLGTHLLGLPFSWYGIFVIEERFGFNKTTPRTFVMDQIKGLALSAVIGLPLLAMILWLLGTYAHAWLYAFVFVAIFSLLLSYLAPTIIMPLFNEFKPLPDGELKDEIHRVAKRCDFPLTEVTVMDGSRRSAKGNAFFTGFGKAKKIALFDTLVESQTKGELAAVLAHEIGHFKRKHIVQGMVLGVVQLGITFWLLGLFLNNEGLHAAFGVSQPSVYVSLVLFGFLYQPLSKVLSIAMAVWSRKNEFEADAYAAEATQEPGQLVSALKKLSRDNLSNLTPHPFYVFLNYSHPPVLERIEALRRREKAGAV